MNITEFFKSDLNKAAKNNNFVYPTVFMFNKSGVLLKKINGQDIHQLLSYSASEEKQPPLLLDKILTNLDIKKHTDKPAIVYVNMIDICVPCNFIKEEFDNKVRQELIKKFELIEINIEG